MQGTVKWFNTQKGYGFITGEDGKDYFCHVKALPEGTILNENDQVTFDAVETDKGMQAQNVQVGGAGEAPADDEPEDEAEEDSD